MNLNNKAQRYLELKEQMKAMESELEAIVAEFKALGSMSTPDYNISVSEQTREFLKGIKEVSAVFGKEALENNNLIGRTTYQVVKVTKVKTGEKTEAA